MKITNRERFQAIAHFKRAGDLFTLDQVWSETLSLWIQQGAPEQFLTVESNVSDFYVNSFFRDYFKFSNKKVMNEVKSGWAGGKVEDIGYSITAIGGSPLVPEYKIRIISKDERTLTYLNGAGQTMKAIKNKAVMPMFVGWPVKDRASWKELKKGLTPTLRRGGRPIRMLMYRN